MKYTLGMLLTTTSPYTQKSISVDISNKNKLLDSNVNFDYIRKFYFNI